VFSDELYIESNLSRIKKRWGLTDDGELIRTQFCVLQPVWYKGLSSMLKLSNSKDEDRGFELLECWDGHGAVKIYEREPLAILMQRATGQRSLKRLVLDGKEAFANEIICEVVGTIHAKNCTGQIDLLPLVDWFGSLRQSAVSHGGILMVCNSIARELLNSPWQETALHGDIHYDNVLDFDESGWQVIDPKALWGERTFDYANLFLNPTPEIALSKQRIICLVKQLSLYPSIDPSRLLKWVAAYTGLSASWLIEEGKDPKVPVSVAELVLSKLGIPI
jgi:streptomycin 6-kinase